jgi:hypothetical protein
MFRLALAACAAALLVAPAAQADPVPLLDAPTAQDIALAGNEVIVPRPGARGRVTVDAVSVTGAAPRRLLTASGPGKGWGANPFVSASPTRVAVTVFYDKPNLRLGDGVQWRLYTGPITGPLRLEYSARRKGWHPIDTAVDGDRVLVSEGKFTLFGTRLRLFEPGAAPRVLPWGNGVDAPIALAGDHLAYAGSSQSGADAPFNRVFVADPLTGVRQVSMAVSDPGELDVAADGRVVVDYRNGLVSAAPGVPKATLPGSKRLFKPRFTGAAVAAVERTSFFGTVRPVVLDPGAAAPRPVGVPTGDIQTLDGNDQGVAWIGNGCVLFAAAGSSAPSEPPAGPCPRAEVQLDGADQTLRGRRVRMVATCVAAPASGCVGRARLRFHGAAGSAPFDVAAGARQLFNMTISQRAARLVRQRVHRKGFAVLPLRTQLQDGRPSEADRVVLIDKLS